MTQSFYQHELEKFIREKCIGVCTTPIWSSSECKLTWLQAQSQPVSPIPCRLCKRNWWRRNWELEFLQCLSHHQIDHNLLHARRWDWDETSGASCYKWRTSTPTVGGHSKVTATEQL
jgi:hypothetical protein